MCVCMHGDSSILKYSRLKEDEEVTLLAAPNLLLGVVHPLFLTEDLLPNMQLEGRRAVPLTYHKINVVD